MGKGAGCLVAICSIYLIGGISSEISKGSYKQSDPWLYAYYQSKGVNLLTWPEIFFCGNYDEQMEFKQNYLNVRKKLNLIKSLADPSSSEYTQISVLEGKLSEGDIAINNAERQIELIGDSFLGNGKSSQLMNLTEKVNSGEISPEQAAFEITGMVPSGFSKTQERFARDVVNKILTNTLQQGSQKSKKPYSEE